jgi:hypothetical protein
MGQSSNYYPQGNGLAESTNKTLIQVLKNIIATNQRNWHKNLIDALWASQLTPKGSTRHSPYTLVYGKEAIFPIHLELNALVVATGTEYMEEVSPLQARYYQLMQLEEHRAQEMITISRRQQVIKNHFDQSATAKYFQKDQLVLL